MIERHYLPGCFANRVPMQRESFCGFLLKLSEVNAYGSIGALLSTALNRDQPRTSGTLARLCHEIRSEPALLAQLGQVAAGDANCLQQYKEEPLHDEAVLIHSCRVDLDALMQIRSQVCPSCLADQHFASEEWDLAPVTCCSTHRVYLVDKCDRCGAQLDWLRPALFACGKCGVDLRSWAVTDAPEDECMTSADFAALAPFRLRLQDGASANTIWDSAFRILKSLTLQTRNFREGEWPERRHFAELPADDRREAVRQLSATRRNISYD